MRLTCTVEGLEANWLELPDLWTWGQQRELPLTDDEMFAALPRMVTACHIEVGGKVIEEPKGIEAAAFDDADIALVGFLLSAPYRAAAYRRDLGNRSGRPSSYSIGAKK